MINFDVNTVVMVTVAISGWAVAFGKHAYNWWSEKSKSTRVKIIDEIQESIRDGVITKEEGFAIINAAMEK
jgi:hypothetical protein